MPERAVARIELPLAADGAGAELSSCSSEEDPSEEDPWEEDPSEDEDS